MNGLEYLTASSEMSKKFGTVEFDDKPKGGAKISRRLLVDH